MDGTDPNSQMAEPNQPTPPTPPQEPVQMQQPTPETPKSSKGLTITLVIILILILVIGGGYYYYITYMKPAETTTSTAPVYSPTSSKSTIQTNYSSATAIEPTSGKSIAVNNIFLPVLKDVFNNEVKLTEDLGAMMTYVVNRKITAADATSIQTGLEAIGYTTMDSSEKQLTVSKGPYTWVITFTVGNENKAVVEITY